MKIIRFIFKFFNNLRKFLHLIVLLLILALFMASFSAVDIQIPREAALVVEPSGTLVEQLEGAPLDRVLAELRGQKRAQTLVRDITDSLESAATDDRVKLVVLALDDLQGGGLPKLQSIAQAMRKVQDAGKQVIAFGDNFTQSQYYLAAHADEVYMHELGALMIDGFAYYRTFFKSALDKLKVDLNIFRVGRFKSAVEPFTRDSMSANDREAAERWLGTLWSIFQRDVTAARGLQPDSLDAYANNYGAALAAAGGNSARVALDAGLVDHAVGRRAFSRRIAELVHGSADAELEQIDYLSYLNAIRQPITAPAKNNVGVLVASGEIVDGDSAPGRIGGDSFANLVARAANDDTVKAVVLRVDSPGGSMFASEVVFDRLAEIKELGKPLIVSMSSTAASGGYYLAMPADEIWASESTITGSIGVFAILPTFQRGLDELGVHVDGIGTTDLAGQLRVDRALGDELREILQLSVDQAYRVFVRKVAAARGMSAERAENLAAGRVWIGADAYELGLVDQLGGLDEAIAAAAERAGLADVDYGVKYIEAGLSIREWLAMEFAIRAGNLAGKLGLRPQPLTGPVTSRIFAAVEAELAKLASFNDPRGLYYHCFCRIP